MKKSKNAFSTTFFPIEASFIDDFFTSLNKQTVDDFDIVILNDGFGDLDKYKKLFPTLNIISLNYSSTPANNRKYALDYVKDKGYENIIFGDSDDTFSDNRVELALRFLETNDIVVNDITLFNQDGIITKNYMSNRLKDKQIIRSEYIEDKNVFGLSNTAIKVKVYKNINFDKDLVALDWFFFTVLLKRQHSAIFVSGAVTNYRQHSENTVGIQKITPCSIVYSLNIRANHYKLLSKEFAEFKSKLSKTHAELERTCDDKLLVELTQFNQCELTHPLWWEIKHRKN